jgi:hypothetical protein
VTVKKELCVVARTYTDKSGETKKVWSKVGEIHTAKDGREYMVLDPMVNLAAVPRKEGDDRVFVSMFDPKPKGDKRGAATGGTDTSDDVPFAPAYYV